MNVPALCSANTCLIGLIEPLLNYNPEKELEIYEEDLLLYIKDRFLK